MAKQDSSLDDFIELKDAAELAEVSKTTITRRTTEYAKELNKELKDISDVYRIKPSGHSISKAFLLEHIAKGSGSSGARNPSLTKVLFTQMDELSKQLKKKDDQLAARDEDIKDLRKLLHQEQVLHKDTKEKQVTRAPGLLGAIARWLLPMPTSSATDAWASTTQKEAPQNESQGGKGTGDETPAEQGATDSTSHKEPPQDEEASNKTGNGATAPSANSAKAKRRPANLLRTITLLVAIAIILGIATVVFPEVWGTQQLPLTPTT